MVNGRRNAFENAVASINESYAKEVTDEFIQPIVMVDENNNPIAENSRRCGDFLQFRTDRGSQN